MVGEGPGAAQSSPHHLPDLLVEVIEHVALLVADPALHRGSCSEDVADRLAQGLGAVDAEQDPLLGIEAAVEAVTEQSVELGDRIGDLLRWLAIAAAAIGAALATFASLAERHWDPDQAHVDRGRCSRRVRYSVEPSEARARTARRGALGRGRRSER